MQYAAISRKSGIEKNKKKVSYICLIKMVPIWCFVVVESVVSIWYVEIILNYIVEFKTRVGAGRNFGIFFEQPLQ